MPKLGHIVEVNHTVTLVGLCRWQVGVNLAGHFCHAFGLLHLMSEVTVVVVAISVSQGVCWSPPNNFPSHAANTSRFMFVLGFFVVDRLA